MKAWHVTAHGAPGEVMSLVDVADPQPAPGHVLCEVSAVALGLPDTLMCRDSYLLTPPLPFTPGQEFAGTVLACGTGARLFEPGDRVLGVSSFITGHGALAERAVVPEEQLYRAGEGMSPEQAAAFFIAYHTGYVGLVTRGKLLAGETLLVHGGAGGVGTAAIQLGKALGANVIATAPLVWADVISAEDLTVLSRHKTCVIAAQPICQPLFARGILINCISVASAKSGF